MSTFAVTDRDGRVMAVIEAADIQAAILLAEQVAPGHHWVAPCTDTRRFGRLRP